eukprot:1159962-Pelagomonas_calceolata.AAC.15
MSSRLEVWPCWVSPSTCSWPAKPAGYWSEARMCSPLCQDVQPCGGQLTSLALVIFQQNLLTSPLSSTSAAMRCVQLEGGFSWVMPGGYSALK